MGQRVTVRGGLMPCADLPTGVVRTVALTETTRRRIARGYYELVDGSLDQPEPSRREVIDQMVAEEDGPLDPAHNEFPPADAAPAGNASTEEWLAFLRGKGIEIPVDDEGETPGREGLKAIWREHLGEG